MRVYELAQALDVPSRDVIARLRADGEWVDSHLSVVPGPVVTRYLPERPASLPARPPGPAHVGRRPSQPRLSFQATAIRLALWPRVRRSPGPAPCTLRRWPADESDDPVRDLRYAVEITTRDVADLLDVTQATVRRWVARGYVSPVGKFGPSNVFRTDEILVAYDKIAARRKATGQRSSYGYLVEPRPADRIRPEHYDAIVSIGEAARLIAVSPATIRSWIHRGHLIPLTSSKPRASRLRLGDVITAAQARRISERLARPRRARPRPAD
jgi:hypothetical protein